MNDFTNKGYAARKAVVPPHPSTTSLGHAPDAHFDGKTTSNESYPKYQGARPSTPAQALMGGGTDAVFHPPGVDPGKWDTESHQQFDKSKLAGASPSKPVFDRSTQQMTHLSYYDPNAKFDSQTTSSGAYHAFAGAKPSVPFKPRPEEGGDTILHHNTAAGASAADIDRFQTETNSRYQHGRAYVKSRTSSGMGLPTDPAHAYAGQAAGAPSVYARAGAMTPAQAQQKSSVFASGPAAGGADMPFNGQKARSVYQNNSSGVGATFGAGNPAQQMPPSQQYQTQSQAQYPPPAPAAAAAVQYEAMGGGGEAAYAGGSDEY